MPIIVFVDSITNDSFNIHLDENKIVLYEGRGGDRERKKAHFTFDPQNGGWSYLKRAVEFYERARLLDERN